MKIGVVGTPDGWSSELLADTVERRTGYRLLVDMKETHLDLKNKTCWYQGIDLRTLDALIIKKIGTHYSDNLVNRLEYLRFLNEKGLPVFSKPSKIQAVLNRLSCTTSLRLANIPMPPTTITENIDEAILAIESYGQAIFKPLYTSKSRGMLLLTPSTTSRAIIEKYAAVFPMMYIQQAVRLDDDRDLGVVFLRGEYLTTYARCKSNLSSWTTSTESGGNYASYNPSQEIIDLAYRAQLPFNLDFTCVDIAITPDGPVVFEVSAFGGFKGIQKACGLDAASLYVDAVLKELRS